MATSVIALMQSDEGRQMVRNACGEAGLDMSVLEQLINAELDQVGKLRKRDLWLEFDDIFAEAGTRDED